jgi:hypothetical protein
MLALRNSPILRTAPLLIAVCFLTSPARTKYSGGSGMGWSIGALLGSSGGN